jgi:polar amino acid transport system substrate-binding protein
MRTTIHRTAASFMAASLVATGLALSSTSASADALDTIKSRGKLVVGVKADYKPFGFRESSGAIVGFEPDLAADVAKRLGVQLELVPVVSANRMEFLKQGKIDLMIATMADTPERRKILDIVEPLYYADFGNVLLKKSQGAKSWEDLKGKRICATSGSNYNKPLTQQYDFDLVAFDGSDRPLLALKSGDCIGYVFDQAFLSAKLQEPEWSADYAMPLSGVMPAPWAIAVAQGEAAFKTFMEKTSKDWAKSGLILDEEKKWKLPPNDFTQEQHKKAMVGN